MGHSVPGIIGSIKRAFSGDVYLILVIVLVGASSFGLGRLSSIEENREPVRFETAVLEAAVKQGRAVGALEAPAALPGRYVASRNGTKYHFPWCSSASRIKEENKIWFNSKEEAARAGYTPAANCDGL